MAKLKKFTQKNSLSYKYLIYIGIIAVLIISFIFAKTYAIYVNKKEYDVIKSKISDFRYVNFSYKLNDIEELQELPQKNTGYSVKNVLCEQGSAEWDNSKWQLKNIDYAGNKYIDCVVNLENLSICSLNKQNNLNSVCKKAIELHTEICNRTTTHCATLNYSNGERIVYGNCGTSGTLTPGDAFDCDVNGDGVYDKDTERFYYVSDYYNTLTKQFESDTAVLIYYNNVTKGVPDITRNSAIQYDSSGENWHGPRTAIANLPTTTQWNNVNLKNTTRAILNENDGTQSGTSTKYNLNQSFSYSGYAARLLTLQESNKACGITNTWGVQGELENCQYFMENGSYAYSTTVALGYWLETTSTPSAQSVKILNGNIRTVHGTTSNNTGIYSVRPVIEVPKINLEI